MGFSRQQAKQIVKQVRNHVREGWNFMTPEVREAMIAAACFSVIRGQMSETVAVKDMDELYGMMLHEAGLLNEGA